MSTARPGNSQKTVSLAVVVLEKRVALLKASQVSSAPSSSLDTLWVMLDMVVIPPLSPCRQRAHMTVEAGDRQPATVILAGGGEERKRVCVWVCVCLGVVEKKTSRAGREYRWQISCCNN